MLDAAATEAALDDDTDGCGCGGVRPMARVVRGNTGETGDDSTCCCTSVVDGVRLARCDFTGGVSRGWRARLPDDVRVETTRSFDTNADGPHARVRPAMRVAARAFRAPMASPPPGSSSSTDADEEKSDGATACPSRVCEPGCGAAAAWRRRAVKACLDGGVRGPCRARFCDFTNAEVNCSLIQSESETRTS